MKATTTAARCAESTHVSRRAVLAAFPAAAVIGTIPLSASSGVDRRAWDEAVAKYESIKAEGAAFGIEYDAIEAAWHASQPSIDIIDFSQFNYESRYEVAFALDLEKRWQDFQLGQNRTWFAKDPEAVKARYRAALDDIKAFRDATRQHAIDSGMDAANDRYDALADAEADALAAVMKTPAPDHPALAYKLRHILELDDEHVTPWSRDYIAQTINDVARLLGDA